MRGQSRVAERLIRGTDLAAASILILLLAPVCLLIALALLFEHGRPVMRTQRVFGPDGSVFPCRQFSAGRSHDPDGRSPTGAFLQRSQLVHFPRLWNVLRGEMTMVGHPPQPAADHPDIALRRPASGLRAGLIEPPAGTDTLTYGDYLGSLVRGAAQLLQGR